MKLRTFFVSPEFWRRIKLIAAREDRSASSIVRDALELWLEQRDAAGGLA